MRSFFGRYSKYAFGLSVLVVVLSLILWIGEVGVRRTGVVEAKITQETIFFDKANPHIRAVMAVQNRHTPDLMALPEVVGTATGLTEAGRLAIVILTKDGVEPSVIPGRLEEVPVVVKVTGEFFAMRPPAGKGKKKEVAPTARFDRPVPIGVSTGHPNITAGTIGCRVTDGENVYALSNNHVYADENNAFIGDNVLQPGTFDGGAEGYEDQVIDGDEIGTLYDYEPINFDGSDNTIDAAIALSSPDLLGNATPSDGYGKPKSAIVEASIGQKVMKYGRTTGLTKWTITMINATVSVGYSRGTAKFVNQIVVESPSLFIPFIQGGDSGSLLVTYSKRRKLGGNPVGLLFAGNFWGNMAIANPIDPVLTRFGVTIDGE